MFAFAAVFLCPVFVCDLVRLRLVCACVCVGGGVGLIMHFSACLFLLLICCVHFVFRFSRHPREKKENLHSFGAVGRL